MKTCLLCGEIVGVDVQTCPKDGEASWGASLAVEPGEVLDIVVPATGEPSVKRGPGRPRKS